MPRPVGGRAITVRYPGQGEACLAPTASLYLVKSLMFIQWAPPAGTSPLHPYLALRRRLWSSASTTRPARARASETSEIARPHSQVGGLNCIETRCAPAGTLTARYA